ncbi:hypothetical protein Glove_220g31 [Diversispora epigaea]|uniref:Cytochrome P450 n=1 Tax=Diversispora epigaea TaxID=1348612 RepID=A0A397IFN9_9GLOM|nr:hypothetical protein Glove_220g31 [Diversispora epigaea]
MTLPHLENNALSQLENNASSFKSGFIETNGKIKEIASGKIKEIAQTNWTSIQKNSRMEATNFLQEILKISLVALIAYISYYYYKYFTRENPLPGPFPLPFIGNIHQIFKNHSFDIGKFQAKYGDLCEFYTGSQRFISLNNDDLIQKIMKPTVNSPFHNRVNDDNEGLKEIGLLNAGLVFNNDYGNWQYHRKFFTKVMMSPSFIKQSVIVVQDNFLELEKYWEKFGENTVFEFNHWITRYFFDTIFITTTSKPAYALANYYNELTPNEKSSLPESILKENSTFLESVDIMKPTVNSPFHNRVNDDNEGLKEIGLLNAGLVFNNDYGNWQYHRKFFTKVMMSPSFIKQSVIVVQDNFLELEKYWEKFGENTVFEFNHWITRYFFDTIFITTTSKPAYALANYYNELTPNEKSSLPESILKENSTFLESVDVFIYSVLYFFFVPRIVRNFPGVNRHTQYIKDRISWLRNNIDNIIKSKREEISKITIDQKLKSDMLTMFLTVNTERDITEISDDTHDKPMSDKDVQENLIEVLSAGFDTSANSLCFLVDFLEKNPRAKQRMIEEIERVLGKDPNSSFTLEDLSKLEYVEATIKEASRLRSNVPTIFKKNSVPEVIGGYKWSKDTYFMMSIDKIQDHKAYWKDPETFNPDRFMDNPESKSKVYMFGGGLRKCPGRNLAMMGLKATLAMLYRKYDIELLGPMKEYVGAARKCVELKVKLRKRKNF